MMETATELLLYLSSMTLPELELVHVLELESHPKLEPAQELVLVQARYKKHGGESHRYILMMCVCTEHSLITSMISRRC